MSSDLFAHVSTDSALRNLRKAHSQTVGSTSWETLETPAFTCLTVLLPLLNKYCHSDPVWLTFACSVKMSSFRASLTEFGLFWAYAVALICSDLSAHVYTDSALWTLRKANKHTVGSPSWEKLRMAPFTLLPVPLCVLNNYCHSDTVWLSTACSVTMSLFPASLTELGLFWAQAAALISSGLFAHVSTDSALKTLHTVGSTSWVKFETLAFTCHTVLLPVLRKYCHSDTVWLTSACSVRISSFWAHLTELGLLWAEAAALMSFAGLLMFPLIVHSEDWEKPKITQWAHLAERSL